MEWDLRLLVLFEFVGGVSESTWRLRTLKGAELLFVIQMIKTSEITTISIILELREFGFAGRWTFKAQKVESNHTHRS